MTDTPEPIRDILARLLPNLKPPNEITQALRDYMAQQKPLHQPPPTRPLTLEPPDLTEPEPF